MIPPAFEYDRPASLDEALDLLQLHADSAKPLAGGQSLIPLLKLRLTAPERLIDIGRLAELRGIARQTDGWHIGALTTYAELLEHDQLAADYPLLGQCIEHIGDVQVRNRATVGGALAHCDPASDMPALALALDVQVVLRSSRAERVLSIGDFVLGAFTTALRSDELLTAILLPPLPAGVGTAWSAIEQSASGYSLVGVAAVVRLADDGSRRSIAEARVALTGVADAPYRAAEVEAALVGSAGSAADIKSVAELGTVGRSVMADIHADAEYRGALVRVQLQRALKQAVSAAR